MGVDRPPPHHPAEAYDYDDYAYSHYGDKTYIENYDYGGTYDLYNGLGYNDFPDYVYDEFDDYNTSDEEEAGSVIHTTDRTSSSSSSSSSSLSSSSLSSSTSLSSKEEGNREDGEEEEQQEEGEETKIESETEMTSDSEEMHSKGREETGDQDQPRNDPTEEGRSARGGESDSTDLEEQQRLPDAIEEANINSLENADPLKMKLEGMEMNDGRRPTTHLEMPAGGKVGMAVDTWRATDDEDLLEGSGDSSHDKIYGE